MVSVDGLLVLGAVKRVLFIVDRVNMLVIFEADALSQDRPPQQSYQTSQAGLIHNCPYLGSE